jgi:predicted transcriptional regulator YdeE
MFKIGDFSRLAQVSVKTLRYYSNLGLLKPAWIDRFTAYRYYTAEQLPRLNRILALKDLGFSLEQIKQLLSEDLTYAEMRGMMRLKQAELERSIQDEQARLARVAARLEQIEQEGALPAYDVVLKEVPPQQVIGIRAVVPGFRYLPPLFDELHGYLRAQNAPPETSDPRLAIYYDPDYHDQGVDVEVAVPLSRGLPGEPPFLVHELPGVESMACMVHQGSFALLGEAYTALLTWVETSGYQTAGPSREVYLQAPQAQDAAVQPVTEIQLPVQKVSTRIFISKGQESCVMEPKIVKKPAFTVVGMVYEGKNQNNEIAGLWERFNPRISEIEDAVDGCFGVCEPAREDGTFRYLAGMAVSSAGQVPEGMDIWDVPASQYAVFPTTLPAIGETYKYVFETWLPGSGYAYASTPDFEYYDESFDIAEADSTFDIYVPIKK